MEKLDRIAQATIGLSIGLFEFVQVTNLVSAPGRQVELVRAYLGMDFAPTADQWRSLDIPGLAYVAVIGASIIHFAIGCALIIGSIKLLRQSARAAHILVTALTIGIAYNLLFSLFLSSWLRIAPQNALGLATLYVVLALYFLLSNKFASEPRPHVPS